MEIEGVTEALGEQLHEIAKQGYQQQAWQAAEGPARAGREPGAGTDVESESYVDADFGDLDDDDEE